MKKIVRIVTILVPLAMMIAQARTNVPPCFHFQPENEDVYAADSFRLRSCLSRQEGNTSIDPTAAASAYRTHGTGDMAKGAAIQLPDVASVERSTLNHTISLHTAVRAAAAEEEDASDEDEEDGGDEQEEAETGWDRTWDAPKLG